MPFTQRSSGARVRVLCSLATFIPVVASSHAMAEEPKFDLSKEKVLYCVGYAHLDTQWRWDFCTTIDKFIKDTLEQNFALFEKYPDYVFNFTGSVRYEMMKEYYPEHYEQLKKYIAQGRWFVSGSSVDEGDVNVPSAEAVIRQVLYGNQYFRREFGKESVDFMLPDCFGFPASMPSIWAHCGLRGFSTQKLTWGSAVGIPFKIGVWEGPDGKGVIAAFDPGSYASAIKGPVQENQAWVKRIEDNGSRYGVWADYHYYGVGDVGGAPREEDVKNYIASSKVTDGPFRVALVSSDQMCKDITDEQMARLPRYKGDLLLTEHSAGTLTSQAYMKRWNRKGECLADAAERAAVIAHWLGAAEYPREKLYKSWVRLLANQMHDILPGTSIPRAYTYSWNDEIVAQNGFAAVLTDSVGAIARSMNTQVEGRALVVFNPLARLRGDLVEATLKYPEGAPEAVRVYGRSGGEVPSQVLARTDRSMTILFHGAAPPLGFMLFDVRPSPMASPLAPELTISETQLENESLVVTINGRGDVASILDKANGRRELLSAPATLVFTHEKPRAWPAWNMDWKDRQKPPIEMVGGPAKIRIVERGPVRVALEVTREARNSIIRQQIRLSRGEPGKRVEFRTEIDWQSTECALKASFPLTASNSKATYNWGLGTIERGNNEPTKYEVPSHEWFDLTDKSGEFGVSFLEDCKYGSDKPSDNEVRLTLLYSPGVRRSYMDQHSQDWGRHDMTYAVYPHRGDWREADTEWRARELNQPLRAFETAPHKAIASSALPAWQLGSHHVDLRAIKVAEESGYAMARVQEVWGRQALGVRLAIGGGIDDAFEVDGQERRTGPATITGGALAFDLSPFAARSFALRLAAPPARVARPRSHQVALPFDSDAISMDSRPNDGGFDSEGRTIPGEMLPRTVTSEGIEFQIGPKEPGQKNAIACRGQTIELPQGDFNRMYLLAAATEDTSGTFEIDGKGVEIPIQCWTGFIGQFDDRIWDKEFGEIDHVCDGKVIGFKTGFIKRDTIAWFCTHRHHPTKGNEAYQFSYLFKYGMDLAPGSKTLRLPNNDKIKILATTAAWNENDAVRPAAPLYDDFTGREPITLRHVYPPPPAPAHEGLTPVARVTVDRKPALDQLSIGPASRDDFADKASGHDVAFRFFDRDGEYAPHRRSGAVGDALPRLNDGDVAQNNDDTQRCVWYDNEGRFFIDLGRSVPIERVAAYSWHRDARAPQVFSLWGSNDKQMPPPDFASGKGTPWTLLAVVDTRPLGGGEVHGSAVTGDGKPLGPYRHLLWIAQDIGQGTFFTEIDVHASSQSR